MSEIAVIIGHNQNGTYIKDKNSGKDILGVNRATIDITPGKVKAYLDISWFDANIEAMAKITPPVTKENIVFLRSYINSLREKTKDLSVLGEQDMRGQAIDELLNSLQKALPSSQG